MDITDIMGRLICIGNDTLYYRDQNNAVQIKPIGNRSNIIGLGYSASDLIDGIYDKHIIHDIKSHQRDRESCAATNLVHCQDLCVSRKGQDIEMIYNEYHRWLNNVIRKAKVSKPNVTKPPVDPETTKPEENITKADRDRYVRDTIDYDIYQVFGATIRYFRGLVRVTKETIEIQYTLNSKELRTAAARQAWVNNNTKRLAQVGFHEICKNPIWKSRLRNDVRYVPIGVAVSAYGDVFIEYEIREPKEVKPSGT